MTDKTWPAVRARRILPVAGALAVAALALAACGGASGTSSGRTPSDSPSSSASADAAPGGGRFGGAGGGAAATGRIAAIEGNTLQVQNTSEQTAVDLSAATSYTLRETTSRSVVKVGSCVVAVAPASLSGTGTATPRPTAITASTVATSPAVNGSCAGGFGAGERPGGAPSSFPSGGFPGGGERTGARPSGFPSGARRGGFGEIVSGKVTKVYGSVITVDAVRRTPGSTTTTTQTDTVTVTATTTYTTTVKAGRSAVKVGLCASAFGETDSTGAVSATRVALSSPQNGSCTNGFGRGFGGGTSG